MANDLLCLGSVAVCGLAFLVLWGCGAINKKVGG